MNKVPAKRGRHVKKKGETIPKAFLPSTGRDDKVFRTIFESCGVGKLSLLRCAGAVSSYQ